MFRRQNSSLYLPSPLSRSQAQADSDPDSTQVSYNYVADYTTSLALEQVEGEHSNGMESAGTLSPASTLSDIDIGYPLERVERVGSPELLADSDPPWPTAVIGSRPSSTDSSPTDYMYDSRSHPDFLLT
jgi:hypothetical protein